MSQENKTVLITGAARGIGWASAETFAGRGWNVTIGDVDIAEAEKRAAPHAERMLALKLDVTDSASVEKTFAESLTHWGRLDALVNNAGIQRHSPLEDLTFENWSKVLDINLNGSFHCLKAAARIMLAQGSGAVVNLASVAATRGAAGRAPYAASKAAIVSLTQTAAVEWAARGVRVNAVAPGYVETDLVRTVIAEGRLDTKPILDRTPARRLADPQEIAKAIFFLCSDEASYITGHVLHVDGGFEADFGVPFFPPREVGKA
ncbi:SDR family NAD(P)-dependent oxidoreductase [Taklimakanibacter deserti]|uniref:SDR family NAD(P)-dependent oxidoreductase n=1 Tax=Taklimakanibacter deserti TaxID=2267839 RepID=UPI0013C4A4DC